MNPNPTKTRRREDNESLARETKLAKSIVERATRINQAKNGVENQQAHHILLVDDDETIRELFSVAFEYLGYRVDSTADGQQGKEFLQHHSVDLVVLDMMMPVMDGLCFLDWLKQSPHRETPVIVMTAVDRPYQEKDLLLAGANRVVYKPVRLPVLMAHIKGFLRDDCVAEHANPQQPLQELPRSSS